MGRDAVLPSAFEFIAHLVKYGVGHPFGVYEAMNSHEAIYLEWFECCRMVFVIGGNGK